MDSKKERIYTAAILRNIRPLLSGLDIPDAILETSDMKSLIDEAEELADGGVAQDRKRMQICNTNHSECRLKPVTLEIGYGDKSVSDSNGMYQPVIPVMFTKDFFPKIGERCNADGYELILSGIRTELEAVKGLNCHAFAETALNVLYKYASAVPFYDTDENNVSLYDHVKTSAALAVCLYEHLCDAAEPENPFLLIGADVSGIQPYIYRIISKYAGKNLKGRSFYLRLMTDAVVRFILSRLELFRANVVYNSGGSFYIIAPNTPTTLCRLAQAVSDIEEKLFLSHGTALYLAIDSIAVSKDILMHDGDRTIGDIWKELSEKRDKKKSSKLSGIIEDNYNAFFVPKEKSGQLEHDVITGDEIGEAEGRKAFEGGYISRVTYEQIKLGEALRDFDAVVVSEEKIKTLDGFHIEPLSLGFHYCFVKEFDDLKANTSVKNLIVFNTNATDRSFIHGNIGGADTVFGMDFYGGNELFDSKMPSFEQMCNRMSEDAFERMGILRMDVDNLGNVFQRGISPHRASLSYYTALSRAFDYFFSGYINTIWEGIDPMRSFIVYSGGDDLFIVGSWEVTVAIAERIHNDFKEFTCGNPCFSISGGIAIAPPKFPIIRCAELSAEEESNAKKHVCCGNEKNSVSFMGMALNWDKEYPQVRYLKESIYRAVSDGHLPKSFISKVLAHCMNAEMHNHTIGNFKTFWMITYDMSRFAERIKDAEAKSIVNLCKAEVCSNNNKLYGQPITTDYHPLELWAMACRWAEIELRQ